MMLWRYSEKEQPEVYHESPEVREARGSNLHRIRTEWIRNGLASATAINNTNELPAHLHQKLQGAYDIVRAANVYQFDPEVRRYKEENSRLPLSRGGEDYCVRFETPSHLVGFNERGMKVVAPLWDGSEPRLDEYRTNRSIFYQATGPWTQGALIQETIAILQRLGDTNMLKAVEGSRRRIRVEPLVVKNPEGAAVRVTPFVTVLLYDRLTTNQVRVSIEYRIGPTGVLGVTELQIH